MIHILENVDKWKCEYKKCSAKCCIPGIPLTIADIKRITALGYLPSDFLEAAGANQELKIKEKNARGFFL